MSTEPHICTQSSRKYDWHTWRSTRSDGHKIHLPFTSRNIL